MISPNTLLLNWLLALPFFGAFAAALFPRFTITTHSPREAEQVARAPLYFGALTSVLGVSLAIRLISLLARGDTAAADYLWTRDLYHLRFQADALSAVAALLAYGCGLAMFLHLVGGPAQPHLHRRASLLLLAQGFIITTAAAADLVLLLFCLGLSVLALALLISLDAPPRRDALLLNGHLAWLAALLGALLMWRQADDTSLAQLPLLLLTKDPSALHAAGLLALFGLTPLVAGAPGYGRWLRAVRAAPGSAGMAAVLLVLGGGVTLLRFLPGSLVLPTVPGLGRASLWAAVVVLCGGAVAAWRSGDLRSRAAWLTVAQAGYLLLAIAGASSPNAYPDFLHAAALHIAFAPLALLAVWLASLTVLHRTRADTLAGLSGLLSQMPFAGLALLFGGLSLVGMPPLAGFREQSLLLSAVAAERTWALLAALLSADVVVVCVVVDTFRRVFLRGRPPPDLRRSSLALELPLVLVTLAVVVAGVWSGPWQRWADFVYRTVLTLRPTP